MGAFAWLKDKFSSLESRVSKTSIPPDASSEQDTAPAVYSNFIATAAQKVIPVEKIDNFFSSLRKVSPNIGAAQSFLAQTIDAFSAKKCADEDKKVLAETILQAMAYRKKDDFARQSDKIKKELQNYSVCKEFHKVYAQFYIRLNEFDGNLSAPPFDAETEWNNQFPDIEVLMQDIISKRNLLTQTWDDDFLYWQVWKVFNHAKENKKFQKNVQTLRTLNEYLQLAGVFDPSQLQSFQTVSSPPVSLPSASAATDPDYDLALLVHAQNFFGEKYGKGFMKSVINKPLNDLDAVEADVKKNISDYHKRMRLQKTDAELNAFSDDITKLVYARNIPILINLCNARRQKLQSSADWNAAYAEAINWIGIKLGKEKVTELKTQGLDFDMLLEQYREATIGMATGSNIEYDSALKKYNELESKIEAFDKQLGYMQAKKALDKAIACGTDTSVSDLIAQAEQAKLLSGQQASQSILSPQSSPLVQPTFRYWRPVLAALSCIAVFATGAALIYSLNTHKPNCSVSQAEVAVAANSINVSATSASQSTTSTPSVLAAQTINPAQAAYDSVALTAANAAKLASASVVYDQTMNRQSHPRQTSLANPITSPSNQIDHPSTHASNNTGSRPTLTVAATSLSTTSSPALVFSSNEFSHPSKGTMYYAEINGGTLDTAIVNNQLYSIFLDAHLKENILRHQKDFPNSTEKNKYYINLGILNAEQLSEVVKNGSTVMRYSNFAGKKSWTMLARNKGTNTYSPLMDTLGKTPTLEERMESTDEDGNVYSSDAKSTIIVPETVEISYSQIGVQQDYSKRINALDEDELKYLAERYNMNKLAHWNEDAKSELVLRANEEGIQTRFNYKAALMTGGASFVKDSLDNHVSIKEIQKQYQEKYNQTISVGSIYKIKKFLP